MPLCVCVCVLPQYEAPDPGQTQQEVRHYGDDTCLRHTGTDSQTHAHRLQTQQRLHTHTHTCCEACLSSLCQNVCVCAHRWVEAQASSGQDDRQCDVPQRRRPVCVDENGVGDQRNVTQQQTGQQHPYGTHTGCTPQASIQSTYIYSAHMNAHTLHTPNIHMDHKCIHTHITHTHIHIYTPLSHTPAVHTARTQV